MQSTIQRFSVALLGFCLAAGAAAGVVGAGPYTVGGDRSGAAGEAVSLSISEAGLTGFAAADLQFSFDSSRLSFNGVADDCGVSMADICGSPLLLSDDGSTAVYSLFVIAGTGDVHGSATLFTLLFTVLAAAPLGDSWVSFVNNVNDFSDPNATLGVYDRESLSAAITVSSPDASNGLPLPGTAVLALTALAWLAVRRQR